MVDSVRVNNPANNSMHYGDKPAIGIIVPPDKLPSKILFSAMDELKRYKQVESDLYQAQSAATPKKKGFPMVLKIALSTFGIWLAYTVLKPSIVNLFKKVFRH
jgi:hypothetical protein